MIKKIVLVLAFCLIFIFTVSIFLVGVGKNTLNILPKIKYDFNKQNEIKENKSNINVYITNSKKIININLEDYIVGVVCSEMPVEFDKEALKAQAVAARTFAAAHMENYGGTKYKGAHGADVTDSIDCQVYMSKEERLSKWPEKFKEEYWNKVSEAVKETSGQVLVYNNKLVMEPYYFAVSSGETEDAKEVLGENIKYLKSVPSPGEESVRKYKSKVDISYINFINKVNDAFSNSKINLFNVRNSVSVLSRNKTGSVKTIKVGNTTMTGTKFRSIIGLNSTNFQIKYNINGFEFDCTGYGHGLGMSQWGAEAMAKNGRKYDEILKHYYTGVEIKTLK